MIRILLKPLLGVILIFAIVATLGLTLWIIKDLWWVVLLVIAGLYLLVSLTSKK